MPNLKRYDNMDVEVWWNDYDSPEGTLEDDVPVCVTLYKDRNYLDYSTLTLTKQEELEMGIDSEIRVGFSEWMSPEYFLTTQHLSSRVRGWAEERLEMFLNE